MNLTSRKAIGHNKCNSAWSLQAVQVLNVTGNQKQKEKSPLNEAYRTSNQKAREKKMLLSEYNASTI